MGDYAATVTVDQVKCERLSRNLGIITGVVDVTNYNTTLSALEDITSHFLKTLCVIAATTDNGLELEWVDASSSFKAWQHNYVQGTPADGPMIQCANDTDVGAAEFIAIGLF